MEYRLSAFNCLWLGSGNWEFWKKSWNSPGNFALNTSKDGALCQEEEAEMGECEDKIESPGCEGSWPHRWSNPGSIATMVIFSTLGSLSCVWKCVLKSFFDLEFWYLLRYAYVCSSYIDFAVPWCRQSVWIKSKGRLTDEPALHRYVACIL